MDFNSTLKEHQTNILRGIFTDPSVINYSTIFDATTPHHLYFCPFPVKRILESSRWLSYSVVIGYEKFSPRTIRNSQFARIRIYVNSLTARFCIWMNIYGNGTPDLGPRNTIILPTIVVVIFHMSVS